MFVTLINDITGLGKKSERVNVSDAYARNVLVPHNLAFVGIQTSFRIEQKQPKFDFEQIRSVCKEPITFTGKANSHDHLYKKITEKDIILEIIKKIKIAKSKITLENFKPIETIGNHGATIVIQKQKFPLVIKILR